MNDKPMNLFQITEDDLSELERRLPVLMMRHMDALDNNDRVAWRTIQAILSRVRWEYGPPSEVERLE